MLDIQLIMGCLQSDITVIYNWACEHKLFLNPEKTKMILLGTPHLLNQIDINNLPNITIEIAVFSLGSSVKSLGVIIDSNLTWQNQIDQTCRKVWYNLKQIKHSHSYLSLRSANNLLLPWFFPLLIIAASSSQTWAPSLKRDSKLPSTAAVKLKFNL